jgi:starch-binding outer membrane protein, SusD/RagB family
MKKILFILIVTWLVLGCNEDLLNKYPVTTLNEKTFWQNSSEAEMALNHLYRYLPDIFQINFDKNTDIAINAAAGGNELVEGKVNETDALFLVWWRRHYIGVSAVNRFLEGLDLVPKDQITMEDYARFRAEARFIRAVEYTFLVNYFGDVPFYTHSIGVKESSTISRTDKAVVIDFIDSELSDIVADLPVQYANDIGRITKGAALAWKARAMLWFKQYQKAADAAKAVIDLGVYELHPDFAELFKYGGEYNKEIVLQRIYSSTITHNFMETIAPKSMLRLDIFRQFFDATKLFVDEFETINGLMPENDQEWNPEDPYRNRDPRLHASLWIPLFKEGAFADTLWGKTVPFDNRPGSGIPEEIQIAHSSNMTGYHVKKYSNIEDVPASDKQTQNYSIIRYADVLLIYAEAKNEVSGPDASIYEAVNRVRNRAGMPDLPVGLSQTEMRDKIRHERVVELGMEGWRFYDIRRWDIAQELMKNNTPVPCIIYRDINTNELTQAVYSKVQWNYPKKNEDHTFPVPWNEYNMNPNLLPQNEGW